MVYTAHCKSERYISQNHIYSTFHYSITIFKKILFKKKYEATFYKILLLVFNALTNWIEFNQIKNKSGK